MKNNIVIFEDKKGNVELRADIEKDTIWATQEQIGQLFQVSVPTVNFHLKNIFNSHELRRISVIRDSLITAKDSKQYLTKFYNLDVIIAVGYRVNSKKATKFRIWATGVLREYLKQGYALNRYKLEKTPEAVEGLNETLALMGSPKYPGKLKGKLVFKLTKDMEPKSDL
jgi:hypothetical protein